MIDTLVYVEGTREVQKILNELARNLEPGSSPRAQVAAEMAADAAEFAAAVSPVWTGTLAASHVAIPKGDQAHVIINAAALNPLSRTSPADYGPIVHSLGGRSPSGGQRAFYAYVTEQHGEQILRAGAHSLARKLNLT